ncbi:MAG: hypothetical protein RBU30_09725, partial [Polyangia bacterium]|nr:hypothetical protein [Polyangia bacterium]
MSSKLSSLLVQDGVVSVKRMEEAFQRQVIFGGSLDTILLEMNVLDEKTLLTYLQSSSGIACADLTAINYAAAQEQTRLFPRKLAEKYLIAPVAMTEGALRVLVTDPPDRGRLDELGFMLGVAILPLIVPEFRIYQALELIYGVKMPLRYAGLVKRLGSPPRPELIPSLETQGLEPAAPAAAVPTTPRSATDEGVPPPIVPTALDTGWDDPFAGAKPETIVGMPAHAPTERSWQPDESDTIPLATAPADMSASAGHVQPIPTSTAEAGLAAAKELKRTIIGVPMRDLEKSASGPVEAADTDEAGPATVRSTEGGQGAAAFTSPEMPGRELPDRSEGEALRAQASATTDPADASLVPLPEMWPRPQPEPWQQPQQEQPYLAETQPQPEPWQQPQQEQPYLAETQPQPEPWQQPQQEQPYLAETQPQPEPWQQPQQEQPYLAETQPQ